MAERLYMVKEVAERFRVTERTIQNWIKTEKFGATKVGKVIRISESDIQEFLSRFKTLVREKHGSEG